MSIFIIFVMKFNGRERRARHVLYMDKGEERTKFCLGKPQM